MYLILYMKCVSLSFSFTHPPEDVKKKRKKEDSPGWFCVLLVLTAVPGTSYFQVLRINNSILQLVFSYFRGLVLRVLDYAFPSSWYCEYSWYRTAFTCHVLSFPGFCSDGGASKWLRSRFNHVPVPVTRLLPSTRYLLYFFNTGRHQITQLQTAECYALLIIPLLWYA